VLPAGPSVLTVHFYREDDHLMGWGFAWQKVPSVLAV
jgi:hypothetical protein